jgi:cysteinyl-tRNA synthetase
METTAASPELITELRDAWRTYVQDKLIKGKGLPDGDKPVPGDEEKSWPRLVRLYDDKTWKQECSKRDEKFEMYFSAAVGQTTQFRR